MTDCILHSALCSADRRQDSGLGLAWALDGQSSNRSSAKALMVSKGPGTTSLACSLCSPDPTASLLPNSESHAEPQPTLPALTKSPLSGTSEVTVSKRQSHAEPGVGTAVNAQGWQSPLGPHGAGIRRHRQRQPGDLSRSTSYCPSPATTRTDSPDG